MTHPVRRRRGQGDEGMSLVIIALAMIVMLLFMAVAIDLGQVYSERRLDQNSADAGATSGAVQFLIATSTPAAAAVDEVVAKVNTDLNRTVSTAEWEACSDANHLAHTAATLGLTPATECISFSARFNRLRVQLPDQTVTTSFSRVVGIDSFTSTAFAIVSIEPAGGGALPFVVLEGNGGGDQICLRTDGTGGSEPPDQPAIPPYQDDRELDPCNKLSYATADGARGTLLPYFYDGCSKPTGNQSIVDSVMVGMDHQIGVFDPEAVLNPGDNADTLDSDPQARIDGDNSCETALPNSIEVDTGFTAQLLRCSLIESPCNDGSSATYNQPGRLHASSGASQFTGLNVNDTPLWDYFVSSLPASAPSSCVAAKNNATEFYTRRAALIDCLQNWNSGQLFDESIADEERLGFVPQVAESGLCKIQPNPAGTACSGPVPKHIHINGFAPVYMDGLYLDKGGICDATNPATDPTDSTPTEWSIHYPGKGLKCAASGSKVSRLSGIVLPCGALPDTVCDPSRNPPFPDALGISNIRLVR